MIKPNCEDSTMIYRNQEKKWYRQRMYGIQILSLVALCLFMVEHNDPLSPLIIFSIHGAANEDKTNHEHSTSVVDSGTNTTSSQENDISYSLIGKSVWDVKPFEHTKHVELLPEFKIDAYNPFHNYLLQFSKEKMSQSEFPDLPLFHSWLHFLEAYHHHFHRFRAQEKVVFMEVGVQSGGKIALLRDYFGPKFEYVGIDINPSTKMFESADWVHIEIGNSANPEFLKSIKEKYPHVDIFLDDGGHTMVQQKVALREMLPHVQPEGIYVVEDLATSWNSQYGGVPFSDVRNSAFVKTTMFGLVHQMIDWLHYGWLPGDPMNYTDVPDDFFPRSWWRMIPQQVKHIHIYNQLVVYEKGLTHKAKNIKTVGKKIPYQPSGTHAPVQWDEVMEKIRKYTKSSNTW